jgi:hypothetical protein
MEPLVASRTWRTLFVIGALILAFLAYAGFGGNNLAGGFWYWLGALLYFAFAFLSRPHRRRRDTMAVADWRVLAALALITLLAIFFRVFRLDAVPAEMTSDHAEKLLDVFDVLNGQRPIFFPRNTGREALQFYLTAALVNWTPLSIGHLALKVGTAIVGIVAVPWTYLLGKELFGRTVGLLAAFFLAISHWHVAITRVGLRFPFTAAFTAPALYFLLRAFRDNRRNDWLAAALFLGVGLHTYTAMRIVPALFALLGGLKLVADLWAQIRRKQPTPPSSAISLRFWENAVIASLFTVLLFLPLLRYMLDEPGMFWYRTLSRAEDQIPLAENWHLFWSNVKNALLMFNYRGDVVPANTVPESPVLGLVSGALLILGVAYLLVRWLRHQQREAVYVLVAGFVMLLPSILSLAYPQENPSVVRTGGAVPLVMIAVALPLVAVGRRVEVAGGRRLLTIVAPLLAALLLLALVDNYQWYFVDYDANVRRSLWNATEMGEVVARFDSEPQHDIANVYHIPFPHWVDTRNIAINAGDITWRNAVLDLDELPAQADRPGAKLYLVHPADAAALKRLRAVYPQGRATTFRSERPGKDFVMFEVPVATPSS